MFCLYVLVSKLKVHIEWKSPDTFYTRLSECAFKFNGMELFFVLFKLERFILIHFDIFLKLKRSAQCSKIPLHHCIYVFSNYHKWLLYCCGNQIKQHNFFLKKTSLNRCSLNNSDFFSVTHWAPLGFLQMHAYWCQRWRANKYRGQRATLKYLM